MKNGTSAGYTRFSVISHWVSGLLLIAMFATHAGGAESILPRFHMAAGPVIGLLLLLRVFYRVSRGLPGPGINDDPRSRIALLAIYAFLLMIVVMVISGYFLPWSQGTSVNLLGLQVAAPFYIDPLKYDAIRLLHRISAYSLAPLLLLHILVSSAPDTMFDTRADGH
jgi:cytochrome b561